MKTLYFNPLTKQLQTLIQCLAWLKENENIRVIKDLWVDEDDHTFYVDLQWKPDKTVYFLNWHPIYDTDISLVKVDPDLTPDKLLEFHLLKDLVNHFKITRR
jgi:hypothetical protein